MVQFFRHHGFSKSWKRVQNLAGQIGFLVFPDKCLKCGLYITRDRQIPFSACYCPQCLDKALAFFVPPFCSCCGHVFSVRQGDNHFCESCLKKRLPLDRVRAAFEYKGIIREAIALFKYQSRLSLAKPFEHHLFEAFVENFNQTKIDYIVPIPLYGKKVRKRGFNQSYLLVRHFKALYVKKYGKIPPWSLDIHSLIRIKPTPSQTGLDIRQRAKNLNQAFECRENSKFKGKSILLCDDVFTSGATCSSAAKTLVSAGAASVSALVLARA